MAGHESVLRLKDSTLSVLESGPPTSVDSEVCVGSIRLVALQGRQLHNSHSWIKVEIEDVS
jgi:hypothetical protein